MKLKERFTIEQALSMNTKELYLFVVEIYEKLKDDEYVMDRYCEQLDRRWWFQPKPTLPSLNFESSAYTCSFYGTRCPRLEGNLRRVEKFLERCNRKSIAREELVVVDKEDIIELMRYSFQEELEFVKNNYAK